MAEMSLWSLFANASVLVKFIMIALLLLSIISWAFIFQRHSTYRTAKIQQEQFEEQFWSGTDLNRLYESLEARDAKLDGMAKIFVEGFREFLRLRQHAKVAPEVVMTGSERSMRIVVNKEIERLEAQLPFLATVGSVSPYIGLLGTVWGIMHAFLALGAVKQASISMVAPGIAEALIATAMGLFAAIPAVVAYNRFSQHLERLVGRYETFKEEFSNILHRQAHLKAVPEHD